MGAAWMRRAIAMAKTNVKKAVIVIKNLEG